MHCNELVHIQNKINKCNKQFWPYWPALQRWGDLTIKCARGDGRSVFLGAYSCNESQGKSTYAGASLEGNMSTAVPALAEASIPRTGLGKGKITRCTVLETVYWPSVHSHRERAERSQDLNQLWCLFMCLQWHLCIGTPFLSQLL